MVAIEFSTKFLKKLLADNAPISKLPEMAAKIGVEVKEVNDKNISIDVTPDRPDMFCAVGFARSINNFFGKRKRLEYKIKSTAPYFEIKVGDSVKGVRPFISGLVAKGLRLDEDSLKDLINFTEKLSINVGRRRKKVAMGIHNLDAIVPPLVYDAFENEKFVPLGSKVPMDFKQILADHKKGQEYANTINESKLYPVLKDKLGIMSMIPIINSDRTKVDNQTKNIFLDITGTSQFLVEKLADMMASYLIDIGAAVYKVAVKYRNKVVLTPKTEPMQIEIPMSKLDIQLGKFTRAHTYGLLANKMGFEAAIVGDKLAVNVPPYRIDVINDQDIVSDITIAYGYEKISPLPIFSFQQGFLQKSTIDYEAIAQLMIGMGFTEEVNSYLTDEKTNFKNMLLDWKGGYVKIKGSRMQSITMLRTHLIPSLLKDLGKSKHESFPQKLFEIDMAFNSNIRNVDEEYHLAAVSLDPKTNFNDAVAIIERIVGEIAPAATLIECDHPFFIPGRSGSIILEGKEIGYFGELHPQVLSNFEIEEPGLAFELNLSTLKFNSVR